MSRPEALYPFLEETSADLDAMLIEVTRSTAEKAREIVALRQSVRDQLGTRLLAGATAMARAFRAGGTLFAFGNGGSGTDADAVVQLFLHPGPAAGAGPRSAMPLPAVSLNRDVALITALTNDVGFDVVFARQVAALGGRGDLAIGLSTSGGSANVVRGLDEAKRRAMTTIGLAGSGGGRMAEAASIDHLFVVPSPSVHRIQEAQTTVYHLLWELTQRELTHADG